MLKLLLPQNLSSLRRLRRSAMQVIVPALILGSVFTSQSSAQANFSATGPQATTTFAAPGFTIFHPTTLAANGVKNPVIAWGNGTGTGPSSYSGLLGHLASYGFVVVAANTPSAGSGAEMSRGIDYIITENQRSGSRFFGKIDTTEIGVSGHSQGGIGAVNVAVNDLRVSAALPLAGLNLSRKTIRIPIFAQAGSRDFIISPRLVRRIYTSAAGPAVYGSLLGASHTAPVGRAPSAELRHYVTAWFRLFLFDETALRREFFVQGAGINADPQWDAEFKNPPQ